MQKKREIAFGWLLTFALALFATGCATKPPQGYGLAKSTASLAQEQLLAAEHSTQVDTSSTYLGLIEQMQQAGHWYASLAHTEAFERQHGSSANVQLLKADALRNTQQYDAAKQIYMGLFNTPQASRAYRGIGLLEASQERYDAAVDALDKARRINPIDANILSDLGYAFMRNGQIEQAHVPAMQAAQLAPNSPRVQLNLVLFLLASGQEALGEKLLQKLQQPTGKVGNAVVGADAISSLQAQVALIRRAAQLRADSLKAIPRDGASGQVIKVSSMVIEAVPPTTPSALPQQTLEGKK